jgi:CheY-like chemotaxis protein
VGRFPDGGFWRQAIPHGIHLPRLRDPTKSGVTVRTMTGPKKVLIVDDEIDLRSIVRLTLQGAGYQVAEAMNGRQALGELEREQPDLMILDIMMPKMNGIELCRAMIDKLKIVDLPVLVLSAINEKSKIIEEFFSLPLGTKSFLRKPIETAEILSRVREMIGEAGSGGGAPTTATTSEGTSTPKAAAPAEPAEPVAAPKPAEPSGPSYRVLVIDDEEDIRTLLRATLTMRHTVELAENGMDALEKIDDFNPDFVLSDINMPVMNGLETVEAIRQHPKFHDIPVFFLTGEKDRNLPQKAFGLGANLFLRKPIDPMQLLKTVDYFVKEAQLMPKPPKPAPTAKPAASAPAGGPAKAAAGPTAGGSGRVRVLTVDENPDTTAVLRKAMPESAKAPWETLWTAEVQTALGNLKRWEPDVIFYNPRNTRMDGIAFVQSLRLKKLDKQYKVVFTGVNFFDADLTYSQRNLGHEVMRLDAGEAKVAAMVGGVIDSVRGKIKPKRSSVVDIEAEHESVRQREAADRKKAEKQREMFRDRFARIQNFIDSAHRHD